MSDSVAGPMMPLDTGRPGAESLQADAVHPAGVPRRVRAGAHQWHLDTWTQSSRHPRALCVLLHGTGASAASWNGLARQLVAHFDLVAPDLPAHARTRTPRTAALDIDAQADALEALLDTLDRRPALLIGHSAGAVIMAAWALRREAAGRHDLPALVALNGALLPLEGAAGWLFQPLARLSSGLGFLPRLFALRAAREPDHVRRLLGSTGSAIDAEMVARYRELLADDTHVAGVLRMMAAWDLRRFAARLGALKTRLHLFAADNDRTIPLRHAHRLRGLLDGASLDVLPGLGHLAHEEAPARVAALILDRLDHPDTRS